MNRKEFIKLSGISTAGLLIGSSSQFLSSCSMSTMGDMNMGQSVSVSEGSFTVPLSTPQVVGNTVNLTAQNISTVIQGFGTVSGLGYQPNSILGPTIKINSGQSVTINLLNQLGENTNTHWHGLKVPPVMDGHPENVISAGSSFNYNFTINQRAGLYWYHPHADGTTAKQAFQGLGGLFVVNDLEESALKLPSGSRELFLAIQDKRISSGKILYSPTMHEQMSGLMGQYVLVNGNYSPFHLVETAKYRVRILNGSNARIYNLALSNGKPFTVIGNDGGLLATSKTVSSLMISPGERADLIIDFGGLTLNSELFLISKTFDGGNSQGNQEFRIMKFKVNSEIVDTYSIPNSLSSIAPLTESMSTKTRLFEISNAHMMGGSSGMMMHTINNKSYDPNRIDETVTKGAVETWIFDNTYGNEPHPMHLHGVLFQILSRTGGRNTLTALESGWKDIALCMPGEKVKVIIPFDGYSGKIIFHCHNLEHEESGMMGQYQVV